MNKIIQDIAEHCDFYVGNEHSDKLYEQKQRLFMEKFAQLIVLECGQYLNSPEFIGRSDLDWAMVLNEHFGVEE
jgi:hypothetical protein